MLKEVRNICYLVVGGGGGGNGTIGYMGQGGGGGGEVLEGVAEITSLSYQVGVGCGGEGQCCTSYVGCETNNGGPSYIGNVVCAKGGFSGKGRRNGGNSGSGCIGGCNRTSCCCNGAGGGAGAGGNGGCAYYSSSVGNYGGCGGVGISSCIEGTEKWYGGGGGGYGYNCQGLGCHGGGNGASELTYGYSYAGTNGTGGGGGGGLYVKGFNCPACNKKFPCDGGSGLVIISYPSDGSYGFNSATGGDCCYECNGMCIHKFCTDGTFSIIS